MTSLLQAVSCLEGYDPDALHVERAKAICRDMVEPVEGEERVFLRDALGRVLSRDVVSPIDVPAHDNSAMDGYALRTADLAAGAETRLAVAGTAFAGRPFEGHFQRGQCVRIMTGAVMPAGADAVVVQEIVRSEGDYAVIPPGQRAGQNWRKAGEDLRAGGAALAAGRIVRPAELGLLASLGIGEVWVRRRLRVAIFSTGDELVSIGTPAQPGEIYDSNRYTLWGMLTRLGCQVFDLGVVRDTPEALEAALLKAAAEADAVITSGGVSVGEADFMRELMARLGEVLFWKIAMKPGRPMAFGRISARGRSAMLFGLPGNPVAVMVTFHQFVRDALLRMMGADPVPVVPLLPATCASSLKKAPGRTEFQRGVLARTEEGWQVRVTGAQGSGILRSMGEANCFIVVEHERGSVSSGETVLVQLMEGLA